LIPPTNFSTFPPTPRETPAAASFHQSSSRPQTRPPVFLGNKKEKQPKKWTTRNNLSTTTNKYQILTQQQASDLDFPARMSSEEERVSLNFTIFNLVKIENNFAFCRSFLLLRSISSPIQLVQCYTSAEI
jgi:hypothetical protein